VYKHSPKTRGERLIWLRMDSACNWKWRGAMPISKLGPVKYNEHDSQKCVAKLLVGAIISFYMFACTWQDCWLTQLQMLLFETTPIMSHAWVTVVNIYSTLIPAESRASLVHFDAQNANTQWLVSDIIISCVSCKTMIVLVACCNDSIHTDWVIHIAMKQCCRSPNH
jgi:hypothetical protein